VDISILIHWAAPVIMPVHSEIRSRGAGELVQLPRKIRAAGRRPTVRAVGNVPDPHSTLDKLTKCDMNRFRCSIIPVRGASCRVRKQNPRERKGETEIWKIAQGIGHYCTSTYIRYSATVLAAPAFPGLQLLGKDCRLPKIPHSPLADR
jgi:hypothetical protein